MEQPESDHDLNEVAQFNEWFLGELEGLAIQAIATGNWSPVYELIAGFQMNSGGQPSLSKIIFVGDGVSQVVTFEEVEPMS